MSSPSSASDADEIRDYARDEEGEEVVASTSSWNDEDDEDDEDEVFGGEGLPVSRTEVAIIRAAAAKAKGKRAMVSGEEAPKKSSGGSRRRNRAGGPAKMKGEPNYKTSEAKSEEKRLRTMHENNLTVWLLNFQIPETFDWDFRTYFRISDDYRFVKMDYDEVGDYVCYRDSQDVLYIHWDNFVAGWRPPFDPFLIEVLNLLKAQPNDFHPNGTRALVGFIVACRHNKIEPYLGLLKDFFDFTGVKDPKGKGLITVRCRTGVTRLLFPPDNKITTWPRRVMRVESKVGWSFKRFPSRRVLELESKWPQDIDVGEGRTEDVRLFELMLGSSAGVLQSHTISARELTDVYMPAVARAGVPGSATREKPVPFLTIPPPKVEDSHVCWSGACHLGKVFPLDCKVCRGIQEGRMGKGR